MGSLIDQINSILLLILFVIILSLIVKIIIQTIKHQPIPKAISQRFTIIASLFLIYILTYILIFDSISLNNYYTSYVILGGFLCASYFLLKKHVRKITVIVLLFLGIISITTGLISFRQINIKNNNKEIQNNKYNQSTTYPKDGLPFLGFDCGETSIF